MKPMLLQLTKVDCGISLVLTLMTCRAESSVISQCQIVNIFPFQAKNNFKRTFLKNELYVALYTFLSLFGGREGRVSKSNSLCLISIMIHNWPVSLFRAFQMSLTM